ncbi:MAG: hypothetical protein EA397_18420 [Deltaproteobacteria bacterium]|nr:MAG: hypothetical protein EA397_18420 [Deltaproteobacteria bacterium]
MILLARRLGAHALRRPITLDDRVVRVSALAALHVIGAFVLTVLGPLWLLLLAPLLLGVPHVAADLRHLVLRPPRPLPKGLLGAVALPFAAMTGLRIATLAGLGSFTTLELLLGAGSVGVAAFWARGRWRIQLVIGAGVLGFLVPALLAPRQAALVIGHAHNLVALGLWVWWMGPHRRGPWLVVALTATLTLALMLGIADPLVLATAGESSAGGLDFSGLTQTLAPDLPAPFDLRIVLTFALLQAVHYSLWIWCIPLSPTFSPIPRSSKARWRRWLQDLGPVMALVVVLGALALPLAGLFAPAEARGAYLSFVLFHGWLELAIAAHLLALPLASR